MTPMYMYMHRFHCAHNFKLSIILYHFPFKHVTGPYSSYAFAVYIRHPPFAFYHLLSPLNNVITLGIQKTRIFTSIKCYITCHFDLILFIFVHTRIPQKGMTTANKSSAEHGPPKHMTQNSYQQQSAKQCHDN